MNPDPCGLQVSSSSRMSSASMERISQWVASQEIPPDLTVRIGDSVFPLHKAVMVPKCGYIRRAVSSKDEDATSMMELDLSAIPGGADAFRQVALYCYGGANTTSEITPRNAAALLCAAAFLDVEDLARRAEEFLAQTGLRTLANAVAVLRSSCEGPLLPHAEVLGVARRAADAVALKVCNEALFRPPGCWAPELAALAPASFGRVVTALRCRRAAPEVIATAAAAYAEIVLAEVLLADSLTGKDQDNAALLESVVEVLPPSTDAPLPAAFLCRLLHAAVNAGNVSAKTCRDLELRVAAVLDQATAEDLLGVSLDAAGERVTHTDTVRRVITAFVERQQQQQIQSGQRRRRASLSGRAEAEAEGSTTSSASASALERMEKVARTVDEAAAEMATEEALPVSKFVAVLGAVPREARRPTHDWVYRAVDVYLKTHPELDEIAREKVCSVMDPLRLSYQARLHASQNKRLPLQAVLTALYYDNLNLRSSSDPAAAAAINNLNPQNMDGLSARAQAKVDASDQSQLARENQALRSELAQIRAYLSGMQQPHSKGSGSSSSPLAKKKKKASFVFLAGSVVTRTLSRLNPFKAAKDTSSVAADARHDHHHIVKPRRRRFSIS